MDDTLSPKNSKNVEITNKVPQEFSDEFRKLHIRPWMRFWARSIDFYVFGLMLSIITGLFYPSFFKIAVFDTFGRLHPLIIFFGWFLIEPFILSVWGTTIGKSLLKITVLDLQGGKPKLYPAFARALRVLYSGWGLGIPFLSCFTLYFSYRWLKLTGTTRWDKDKYLVTHGELGATRAIIVILIIIAPIVLNFWGLYDGLIVVTLPDQPVITH